jgi:hypothetical protein
VRIGSGKQPVSGAPTRRAELELHGFTLGLAIAFLSPSVAGMREAKAKGWKLDCRAPSTVVQRKRAKRAGFIGVPLGGYGLPEELRAKVAELESALKRSRAELAD